MEEEVSGDCNSGSNRTMYGVAAAIEKQDIRSQIYKGDNCSRYARYATATTIATGAAIEEQDIQQQH